MNAMSAAGGPASTTAVVAGVLVFAVIFMLAAAARGAPARRPPPVERRHSSRADWRRWRWIAIVTVAALMLGAVGGPLAPAVIGGVVLAVMPLRRRALVARRRREIAEAMPDAIELFVLCVHAGASPTQAIDELARSASPPVREAFAAVELQLHRGRRLADALAELPRRAGLAGQELASAVASADRDGVPLAPVLERLASEARSARRRAGEAAARRLPVQLSFPLVLCTLPSFVLLAIAPAVFGALSTLRGRAP